MFHFLKENDVIYFYYVEMQKGFFFFFTGNLLHAKFIQFANYQKQLYLEALYPMTNF